MQIKEIAEVCRKAADSIEILMYQNTKLLRLIEDINQRSDVSDSVRHHIHDVLDGKGKEKLN